MFISKWPRTSQGRNEILGPYIVICQVYARDGRTSHIKLPPQCISPFSYITLKLFCHVVVWEPSKFSDIKSGLTSPFSKSTTTEHFFLELLHLSLTVVPDFVTGTTRLPSFPCVGFVPREPDKLLLVILVFPTSCPSSFSPY